MTLRATTLLAANTEPMLDGWVQSMVELGVSIGFDEEASAADRHEQVREGEVDLVFACGLLTAALVDDAVPLEVAAAPVFAGEERAVYRSVVVARTDSGFAAAGDAVAGVLAVNEYDSWSGWHGYKAHRRERGEWADGGSLPHVCTGSHVRSIEAVLSGEADVAAVDHTVWRDWIEGNDASGLIVIDTTPDWPAPPISISTRLEPEERERIGAALVGPLGLVPAHVTDYEFMLAERSRP